MKTITVSSPSFSKNKILVEELYKSFPDSVIKINSVMSATTKLQNQVI
jgi:hypothetical protein